MAKKKKQYELLWRNKFITIDADSMEDMIESYTLNLKQLSEMNDLVRNGDLMVDFSGAGDDYICFITENEKLAAKFQMNEV